MYDIKKQSINWVMEKGTNSKREGRERNSDMSGKAGMMTYIYEIIIETLYCANLEKIIMKRKNFQKWRPMGQKQHFGLT